MDELGILGHRLVGVPCLSEVGSVGHEDGTEHDFVVQEVAPEDLDGADNGAQADLSTPHSPRLNP